MVNQSSARDFMALQFMYLHFMGHHLHHICLSIMHNSSFPFINHNAVIISYSSSIHGKCYFVRVISIQCYVFHGVVVSVEFHGDGINDADLFIEMSDSVITNDRNETHLPWH